MRRPILAAAAALALSACGNNDQTDNSLNIDENLTAENIVANDVTAIDAVTGDAANMAADVDINFTNEVAVDDNAAGASAPSPSRTRPTTPTAPKASNPPPAASAPPVAAPATNTTE